MALDIQNTSYSGETAGELINSAYLNSRTLAMNGVRKIMNIKYRHTLQNFNNPRTVFPSTCNYTDRFGTGNEVDTNEVSIEPKELETLLTLCKQEFHDDWQSKYQFGGAMDDIPNTFEGYLLAHIGGLIGSSIEEIMWRGDTSLGATNALSVFDGFATRLAGAPTGDGVGPGNLNADGFTPRGSATAQAAGGLLAAQDLTAATTLAGVATGNHALTTVSSVKGELNSIIQAIPSRVYSKGPQSLMIYLGLDTIPVLVEAFGGTDNGINNQQQLWWNGGFSGLRFNGIPIFVGNGLTGAANPTAIATYRENLVFGTGLDSDFNAAKVIDQEGVDGSRNVRIVYRYTAGTQIGNVRDCVYYSRAAKA